MNKKAVNMIEDFLVGLAGSPEDYFQAIQAAFTDDDAVYHLFCMSNDVVESALIVKAVSERLITLKNALETDFLSPRHLLKNARAEAEERLQAYQQDPTMICYNLLVLNARTKCLAFLDELDETLTDPLL